MRKFNLTIRIPVVLDDDVNPDDFTGLLERMSGKDILGMLGLTSEVENCGCARIELDANYGVDVTCGGESIHWSTREAAIKFYTDACNGCDPGSSEHSRYSLVLTRLLSGMADVTDQ